MGAFRLNLPATEASLHTVQADFAHINSTLEVARDTVSDEVRVNMMAGYCLVDRALAQGMDLLELGNSKQLLELNILVLCGTDDNKRRAFTRHIVASEQRFYEQQRGGIGALMEWLQRHKGDDVWMRAAGVYIHILSRPELY